MMKAKSQTEFVDLPRLASYDASLGKSTNLEFSVKNDRPNTLM